MEWTQLLALAGYTTAASYFFYRLNEKTIAEWRAEHQRQIEKMDIKLEKMDAKWERLFERLLIQDKKNKPK